MHLTKDQEQHAMWVAELLQNRDPLYKIDFNRMINRHCKMHPSDYMRHYTAAAKIIIKCAEELSNLPMHPDATPRTPAHWLNVLLGAPNDLVHLGRLELSHGSDCDAHGRAHPLLDMSTHTTVD